MIASIGLVLLGAAAGAATPCENLASLKLADTTITSAVVVPEGPPPVRGGGGGARVVAAPAEAEPLKGRYRRLAHRRSVPEAVRLRRISRLIAGFRWFSSLPPTP